MCRKIMFGGLAILLLSAPAVGQTVSFASLLDEMVSREAVARFPDPAYTCRQASSYDRDSVAPDKPGWFANADRSQFVRTEKNGGRTEYVLMDESGPGAIVRFWATWHGPRVKGQRKEFTNGALRIYLDGQAEPAIEGPIASILDGGGLVEPPLSEGVSSETIYAHRGHNLYLPIPYARHCKITYETSAPVDRGARSGEALYYQVNYRTYAAGTDVESFKLDDLEKQQAKLRQVQQRLASSGLKNTTSLKRVTLAGPLDAGATRTATIDGPAAIAQIVLNLRAENKPQALRSTIISITFDGQPTVWCPLGAFFGIGYQFQPYRSWYTEVTADGNMRCFWVMPFTKSCRISLTNLGDQQVQVTAGEAQYGPWQWDDRSMHFHAGWKQLTKVATFRGANAPGAGAYDVNYVEVHGQGVYVGDTLTIFNGADAWWGEGDEKIYVDGESFPSHIGTGTEDYYGYAWCKPAFFCSPFHAQPTGSGNLKAGFSVNSRYRSLDAIPFTKEIKFDMELWHWANTVVNFAPATFCYARPGAFCNVSPDPATAAKPVALAREDVVEIFRAKNAVEGETLKILEKTGGQTEIQRISQFRWSDDAQLWWRDGKVGDKLVLEFPVAQRGRYEVVANLTKAVDYGIVTLAVNDNPPTRFDRDHTQVDSDKLVLGTFDLSAGANRLTIEIVGANDKAVKKHMFGLDYLQLLPKP